MNLSIRDNMIYADNLKLCLCEAGNGRPNLPHGRYEVTAQFSHVHGRILPDAIGLGWIGASPECDIVLGGVRGRNGVIPSPSALGRLLALIEAKEDMGTTITLEVQK
jgi:hypothetical protein